jgi:hypothetical protein
MLEVHRGLLHDEIRTNAFRDAIRRVVTPDSVVLDLGTGSGILSFFACEAGARRVFAIDATHSADLASFLSRQLGYSGRIQVFHERSTTVELPEPADILITETIGAFAFDERILSSVIDARARLLKPEAIIVPRRVELYLVPVDDASIYKRSVSWWTTKPYGLDLSALSVFASNVVYVGDVGSGSFLAPPEMVITADLTTITNSGVSGSVQFTTTRAGLMHGFAGWFRATLVDGIELSNEIPGTNWEHVFLPLQSPIAVEAGTPIDVNLESSDGLMWRWKGTIGDAAFDQMTTLATPPCYGASL